VSEVLQRTCKVGSTALLKEHLAKRGNAKDLRIAHFTTYDVTKWDLGALVHVFLANLERVFARDFDCKDSEVPLAKILLQIKGVRNRRSHNQDFTAQELYDEIQNLKRFFLMVRFGENTSLSTNRELFIQQLEESRV